MLYLTGLNLTTPVKSPASASAPAAVQAGQSFLGAVLPGALGSGVAAGVGRSSTVRRPLIERARCSSVHCRQMPPSPIATRRENPLQAERPRVRRLWGGHRPEPRPAPDSCVHPTGSQPLGAGAEKTGVILMFSLARFRSGDARRAPADTGAFGDLPCCACTAEVSGTRPQALSSHSPAPLAGIRLRIVKPFITASAPDSSPP